MTTSYNPGDIINAYGINVRRASGDPVWSGVPDLTSSPTRIRDGGNIGDAAGTAQPSSGSASLEGGGELSSGAKIGIGVGVSLGALLVIGAITAAYFIGKHSRRKREEERDEAWGQDKPQEQVHITDASQQQREGERQELSHTQQAAELPAERGPVEMGHRFF